MRDQNDQSSPIDFGLGEAMLRRVGRRPFLTWIHVSLALAWAWLLVQLLVGVPWGSLSTQPPPRNLIRYADLQGKRAPNGMELRYSEAVLAADPAVSPFRFASDLQFFDRDKQTVVTLQTRTKFDCGWPLRLFSGTLWSAWDVTDPERGYPPATGVYAPIREGVENSGIVWISADDSENLLLRLQRAGVWSPVVIAALPIAPVIVLWIVYGLRQQRRRARRACRICGHERGPSADSGRCTECGIAFGANAPAAEASGQKRMIRAVRLPAAALLLWMTVTCAAFAAFWLNAGMDVMDEAGLREQAQWHADYARQEGKTTPSESGLRDSERQIGWPWPIVTIEEWRWYAFNLDATYAAVPVDPDISFRDEHPDWDWHVMSEDPFVLNWYHIKWRPGVFVLGVTAFIAGNILLAIQFACVRRSRRTRSMSAEPHAID